MAGRAHNPDHIYNPVSVGGEGPKPGWGESIAASFRLGEDTQDLMTQMPRNADAYKNLLAALDDLGVDTSEKGPLYKTVKVGLFAERTIINREAILAEVARRQAINPGHFKNIPTKVVDFDKAVATRTAMTAFGENAPALSGRQKDQAIASRSGWVPNLIGGMGSAMTDPVNLASMAVSGGQAGIWRTIAQEAAVGALSEIAMLPDAQRAYDRMGEGFTVEDQIKQVAVGAVGGAALGGAIKIGGDYAAPVIGKGWSAVKSMSVEAQEKLWTKVISSSPALQKSMKGRLDWDALDDHLPDLVEGLVGRENLSVDEKLAVTMLRRKNEVEAANPYRPTGVGITAHNAAFDAHIRRVADDIVEMRRPRNLVQAATDGPSSIAGMSNYDASAPVSAGGGGFSMGRYLRNNRAAESGGSDVAAAETSSAFGRYQFLKGTWLSYYKKVYGETGESNAAILRKRGDGDTQDKLMAAFTNDNIAAMRKAGVPVTDGSVYLAHFLGVADAKKVMRAGADTPIGDLVSAASIRANPAVFGKIRNAGDLAAWADRKMRGQGTKPIGADDTVIADLPEIDPEAEASAAIAARGVEIEAERAVLAREANADDIVPVFDANGMKSSLQSFRPGDIDVDANLMQFKSGGDDFGVTERLRGVQQWDPIAAGSAVVWESIDGRRLIADGHQRLGLAKRLQAADPNADIMLDARVLREADGISARDARIITALKNIGEGTGTSADAAKVFREGGEMAAEALANRLPPKSVLVRDGKALSRLSDEAFGAIVNEVVPEHWGAVIGHLAPDPDTHMALIDLLAKIDPPNRRQAEGIIRQALEAGFSRETQEELFGSRDVATALFAQRARAVDRTLAELRKLKGVFSVAARNVDTLESAGNRIDAAASMVEADGNAMALGILESLAYRKGHVSDIFNSAAQRLANGEPIGRVVADVVAEVRKLDLQSVARESKGVGGDSGSVDGSGRSGQPDGQNQSAFEDQLGPNGLEPRDAGGLTAEERAQLDYEEPGFALFDDPVGPGSKAMADGAYHDLKGNPDTPDPLANVAFAAREGADETAEQAIKGIEAEEAALKALRDCL